MKLNLISKISIGLVAFIILLLVASLVLASQSSSIVFLNTYSWSKSFVGRKPIFIPSSDNKQIQVISDIADLDYQQELKKAPQLEEINFVLYLHGNAGRLDDLMSGLGDNIRQTKLSIVSPSYPGYHESEGSPTVQNTYQTAIDTYDWLVNVKKIPENKIIILGHSLGGSPAAYLASKKPKAKKLVLINTFSSVQSMCFAKYSILCMFTGDIFNTAENAKKVTIPVRQYHLKTDSTVPFYEGEKLFKYFTNTQDKKFTELTRYTHSVIDWEVINKDFLEGTKPINNPVTESTQNQKVEVQKEVQSQTQKETPKEVQKQP
jgi:predicted esterase